MDHGDHKSSGDSRSGPGNATDAMFVNSMIPHHEGAVEMAQLAKTRAEHPEVKQLAAAIVTAQEKEIATMAPIKAELAGEHGDHQMEGDHHVEMTAAELNELKTAKPFDRTFIDLMVPHHEGALTMAEEQLEKGENEELRTLAQEIIDSQKREIAQMRDWREQWYGSAGASGGGHSDGHDGH
jgi:uncharacterized protein (DUF305 family)